MAGLPVLGFFFRLPRGVFITAVPFIKLFAWGEGECVCVFITAVPNTKLCAWGEEDSGGHVL
jgi:hypothetical protein